MPENYWLLKTEPSVYSFEDLEREGQAVWDGVTNNLALKHMRSFQPGDRALIYHTGEEKRAVGIARATSGAYPDPQKNQPSLVVVNIEPEQRLPQSVSLADIRKRKVFEQSPLVRSPRLSVVPLHADQWQEIMEMAGI